MDQCKVLHLGKKFINFRSKRRGRDCCTEAYLKRFEWTASSIGVSSDRTAKEAKEILVNIKWAKDSKNKKVIVLLNSALVRLYLNFCAQLGIPL